MEFGNDSNNRVYIYGEVETDPEYSHDVYDEVFYTFTVQILRLSGKADHLHVTISERLLTEPVKAGNMISALGQLRSYSSSDGMNTKHFLSVFVRELLGVKKGENPNSIILVGYICRPPVYRMTGNNREITDLLLAVNRSFGKSDYIPAIAWGKNARFMRGLEKGDRVAITGRIQSRKCQIGRSYDRTVTTAYEVSVAQIMAFDEVCEFDVDAEFDLFAAPRDDNTR